MNKFWNWKKHRITNQDGTESTATMREKSTIERKRLISLTKINNSRAEFNPSRTVPANGGYFRRRGHRHPQELLK